MFRSFFWNKRFVTWAWGGSLLILLTTQYRVTLDVKINDWFGDFYDILQKALATPNSVEFQEFLSYCLTFAKVAGIMIIVAVLLDFFVRHFVFQWRTAMNNFYTQHWDKLRHIEGAAQRIQEDTMRFARIMESLMVSLLHSVLVLIAFWPMLKELSKNIKELPWIGAVDHSMAWLAICSALFGTVILMAASVKLPGLEFNNQRVEAAYRKELVLGEDDANRAEPPTLKALYEDVRKNYFTLYINYLYFDLVKWSYLQASVILPYIALAPSILAGAITLGLMQQIIRAFGRVENSFQFLVNSWGTVVEWLSIYKRLKAFEQAIKS
ncbi:MAG: putative transporter [Cardiobacteriaceae bacterium]|nr:putative transporter [Cardiobacteriaceae bacterium]